tara:strand:- start:384 stop:608 length:225 start_codon:yes stop_codon:yes gene_type:complete
MLRLRNVCPVKRHKNYSESMKKPRLLQKTPQGATIHSYDLMGGHTLFHRFLACYKGSCAFYGSMEEAELALTKL